ncbi:GntR family transcriptional regulator [Sedimenticola hydrogenitrophicus]|uniref:GntR family transcriptional regulator n=1 Tax=Sedimenticola hydrogenitrophicus TaxID=2967975 RepID=UPI0023AE7D1F|nr:GntR family transcriptional regulator [Sedimenticola hydrogenitrophicus]
MSTSRLTLQPIRNNNVLKDNVYKALKDAITSMDIYNEGEPPKLDERRLAEELGVSRTPVREAIARLEHDGLVETIPRRGASVVRKTKQEILDIIYVWAALESMAARIATEKATDKAIAKLRKMFVTFDGAEDARAHIDEYSDTNLQFHQSIIDLANCELLSKTAASLLVHMRAIRSKTIRERDRADKSVIDHLRIIEAIEDRDTELAERLVREHTLNLGKHVEQFVDYLK